MIPPQKTVEIAFLNVSSVVTADELTKVVAALQLQVSRDFGPIYGMNANLTIASDQRTADAIPEAWQIIIGDNSDQVGALGYHELTANGAPLGKVFAKTDKDAGLSWSVTASHELLEMLGDPWACLCAQGPDGKIRAYEVCDACEDDSFGYSLDGGFGSVMVSDFVLPSWFDGSRAPYDFQNKVTAPGQLLRGGYISIFENNNWSQVEADHATAGRQVINPASRRARRLLGRSNWLKSETK